MGPTYFDTVLLTTLSTNDVNQSGSFMFTDSYNRQLTVKQVNVRLRHVYNVTNHSWSQQNYCNCCSHLT